MVFCTNAVIEKSESFWDPEWDADRGKLIAGVRVGVGRAGGGVIGGSGHGCVVRVGVGRAGGGVIGGSGYGCVVRMGVGVGNGDEGEGSGGKVDEGEGWVCV